MRNFACAFSFQAFCLPVIQVVQETLGANPRGKLKQAVKTKAGDYWLFSHETRGAFDKAEYILPPNKNWFLNRLT